MVARETRPTQVNIHDAKTGLSNLIERVEAGEEIIIARAGLIEPMVLLTNDAVLARYGPFVRVV